MMKKRGRKKGSKNQRSFFLLFLVYIYIYVCAGVNHLLNNKETEKKKSETGLPRFTSRL